MEEEQSFDICIIGAGIAGAGLAAYLGKTGLRIAVVEKSMAERDVIIGELLQPGGVIKLQEMGLQEALTGFDAQQVQGYALFMNGENFRIAYPKEQGKTVSGRGFRNGKFLQALRGLMLASNNVSVFEGSVETLLEEDSSIKGVKYTDKRTKEERTLSAKLTIASDGMFSAFRQQLSVNEKKVSSYFLGLILKDCNLPYANHGHVIVAKPSPCLIYPISGTETRMLIDFPWEEAPRKSAELTDYLINTIGPQLPIEIMPSYINAVQEGRFKVMPNHLIPAKPVFKQGAVLLGDSLNMRHPLTGGGMTVAFTDVKNLADRLMAVKNFDDTAEINEAVKGFYETRHQQNATINILADALYGVMSDDDLKEACYTYLKRGGRYSEEPISILSAVSRDEDMLLKHFFSVALYGAKNIMSPYPTPTKIKRSWRMMGHAVNIVSPLVLNEKPGLFTKYALRFSQAVF